MTATITHEIKQKAAEIIAVEIKKIPANTMMDYGTLGREVYNHTKRQGEAKSMALYFVKTYGRDADDEEKSAAVEKIIEAALNIVGSI